MHITSATQSQNKLPSEQSGYWPSWGNQLCKSVLLTTSSVGLGWLVSKLWKGSDPQAMNHTDNGHQLAAYRKEQNDCHWTNTEFLSAVSMEVCAPRPDSESLFQKLDISYRDSVRNDAESLGFSNPISGTSAAGFLVTSLLAGGSIQHASLTPAALGLLMLSMPGSAEAWNNDAVPVGSIIAYASTEVPEGYLRCDGAMQSKTDYPELYAVLRGHCEESGGMFKTPDYRDLFLRGAKETADLGKVSDDTTRMPRKPFQVDSSGIHDHIMSATGEHQHGSLAAGKHSHTLDPQGGHTHTVSSEGPHTHTIHNAGEHKHTIHADNEEHTHQIHNAGQHNHHSGAYNRLLQISGGTKSTVEYTDVSPAEPDLVNSAVIQPAGDHFHYMSGAGKHSHSMAPSGDHTHTMTANGEHKHKLDTVVDHTHKVSSQDAHSHDITPGGKHKHDIAESGAHMHAISGGDKETSPKNAKVFFLIKAKPEKDGPRPPPPGSDPMSVITPLATAVLAVFIAKVCS